MANQVPRFDASMGRSRISNTGTTMSDGSVPVTSIIILLKSLTLFLGGSVTYLAFKAYRRNRNPALRAVCIGFGVVTVGVTSAGFIDQALTVSRSIALIVESGFNVTGFAIILYSLYVD